MLVNAEEPTSVVFEHSFAASKDKSTSINCCMFSSDSKYIAAGSADSLVKLWELHKNNDVNSIIKSHIGSVTSLAWIRRANQGEILASASSIGDIYLHTAKTSVVVQMLSAKSEPVNMIRVLNS